MGLLCTGVNIPEHADLCLHFRMHLPSHFLWVYNNAEQPLDIMTSQVGGLYHYWSPALYTEHTLRLSPNVNPFDLYVHIPENNLNDVICFQIIVRVYIAVQFLNFWCNVWIVPSLWVRGWIVVLPQWLHGPGMRSRFWLGLFLSPDGDGTPQPWPVLSAGC